MMMNADSVRLMPATSRMVLRMTGHSPRRKAKLSAMSPATMRRTPWLRSARWKGMRTTHTMSTADTAKAAPATATTGSMPNSPNTSPPITGPTKPDSALIWLTMAVARTMPSRGATKGTAACTVGWYTLCAAYSTMSAQMHRPTRSTVPSSARNAAHVSASSVSSAAMMRRLFTRSAATPPIGVSTRYGSHAAADTAPMSAAEPVTFST